MPDLARAHTAVPEREVTFDPANPAEATRTLAAMNNTHTPADPHTIVVATDGSSGADAALEWAITEAQQTGRRIMVVHVSPLSESVVIAPFTLVGFPDAASYAAEVLRRAAARCRQAGVAAFTKLVEGSPVDSLVDVSHGAAMLVVGATGHGQAATLLLGSVSQDCARRAKCPVVIVKPPASADPASPQAHRRTAASQES